MIVVSNTTPLINLAWLGRFDLLHDLYQRVLIPDAVWEETVGKGKGRPGASEVVEATWIERLKVANSDLVLALRQDLDDGEAEAIALAVEQRAGLLIMDERLGRQTAEQFGIRYIGTIGMLISAKQKGSIAHVKPYLDALRRDAGFYVSDPLYRRILLDIDE